MLVFIETWFHLDIPNSLIELEGFPAVCTDISGECRGRVICVCVNDSLCTSYTVRETACIVDVELCTYLLDPYNFQGNLEIL